MEIRYMEGIKVIEKEDQYNRKYNAEGKRDWISKNNNFKINYFYT